MFYPFVALVLSEFFQYFFQTFELSVKLTSMHVLAYRYRMEVEFQTIVEKHEWEVNIYWPGVAIYDNLCSANCYVGKRIPVVAYKEC